jgi:Acyl-CoA dehydrogenase, middle domain
MLGRESVRSQPGQCGTARDWRVTGQKVWTTWAHLADFTALLARTDPDASNHKGLTYFLIATRQPGVQVLPLRHIGGEVDLGGPTARHGKLHRQDLQLVAEPADPDGSRPDARPVRDGMGRQAG